MIRRKEKQAKQRFLGFDKNSIKEMTKDQFEHFNGKKRAFERNVVGHYQILVTTCGNAATKLIRDLKIKRVVIDEAT